MSVQSGTHGTRLRIAIPIHSFDPGGVERVALNLASEWHDDGHDVTVVLGRSGSGQLASAPPLDYWRIPTRMRTEACRTAWMIHCLYSFLVARRVDVLFCPGNTYAVVGVAMRMLLGRHCPPVALKISNALARDDMSAPMRRGYGAWLRVQGKAFDRLVALSAPMGAEVRALTGAAADRVAVIANPILTGERFARLSRRSPSVSAWGTHYLAAGRLVPQKNFALALRAFARARRPGDILTIAGEGPERRHLERLAAELGIGGQLRLPGHQGSLDGLLAQADALVLSSDYEGLPGVVVEALAAGLPIVATDCSVSMPALLDHGRQGLLVRVGDEAGLAAALHDVRRFAYDPVRSRAIARRHLVDGAAAEYLAMMRDMRARRSRDLGLEAEAFGWARAPGAPS